MEQMRPLKTEEKAMAEALWRSIFPEDTENLVRHYFVDREDIVGVEGLFTDGILTSMIHLNRYQVFFRDLLYDVRYIVGVATEASHRRKGQMSRLMNHCLEKLFEDGDVFALLMPVDSSYYTPFGFRFIQDVEQYRFKVQQGEMTTDQTDGWSVSPVGYVPIHSRFMKKHPLHVNRGMRSFELLDKELAAEGGRLVGVGEGYMAVYDSDDYQIREAVYDDPRTLKEMLSYAAASAGNREIQWQMPAGSPLKHLIPHRAGNTVMLQPFMMARIINAFELLSDLAVHMEPCSILVEDTILKENNGFYRIGDAGVTKEKAIPDETPDIALDVGSLAQWLFGYEELETLEKLYDNVVINRETAVSYLAAGANYFNEFI